MRSKKQRYFSIYRSLLAVFFVLACCSSAFADSSLLFKEWQLVVGSRLRQGETISYSRSEQAVMQKPSIGFDYLHRFSDDYGDKAVGYVQGRIAWKEQGNIVKIEPQLFNAYIRFKNPNADYWIGHSRTAYGLASYLDSHPLLLPVLGMYDLGFDRDWGFGILKDQAWGDFALSYTMGSGMPVHSEGNNLLSGRVAYGILKRDNFNVGFSKANGYLAQVSGYEVTTGTINNLDLTGIDASVLYENYEIKAEGSAGRKMDMPYNSTFFRCSSKYLEDENLKVEIQQITYEQMGVFNLISSIGFSFEFEDDTAVRLMYQDDKLRDDSRIVMQMYYYGLWE